MMLLKSRDAVAGLAGLVFALSGCQSPPAKLQGEAGASGPPVSLFVDAARAAGITNTHHKPILDHQLDNINSWVSSVGAAAAAADFDRDGWIDLYVTDSRQGFPNHLYRNKGDGTFIDV